MENPSKFLWCWAEFNPCQTGSSPASNGVLKHSSPTLNALHHECPTLRSFPPQRSLRNISVSVPRPLMRLIRLRLALPCWNENGSPNMNITPHKWRKRSYLNVISSSTTSVTFPLHIPPVHTHVTTLVAVLLQKINTIRGNLSHETTMLCIVSHLTGVLAAEIFCSMFLFWQD